MKNLKKYLNILRKSERKSYHPLIHKIHGEHRISKRTLLYIKEYGSHSHVFKNIFKESIKMVLFAAVISSFGGFALENIKPLFISIIPLLILMPTFNDMFGDYGIILSSRLTTLLHMGKVKSKWYKDETIKRLFFQILGIALITAFLASSVSMIISYFSDGFILNSPSIIKIFAIAFIDVIVLVTLLFLTAVYAGYSYFKNNEDPDNTIIPLTTAIADFGNMIILSILVILFF